MNSISVKIRQCGEIGEYCSTDLPRNDLSRKEKLSHRLLRHIPANYGTGVTVKNGADVNDSDVLE